uniref:Uncharacterized protein n=1 Tax=Anopheles funestus TaxID=62324 RepID=A0A4Y0BMM4_ANOFN
MSALDARRVTVFNRVRLLYFVEKKIKIIIERNFIPCNGNFRTECSEGTILCFKLNLRKRTDDRGKHVVERHMSLVF